MKQKNANLLLIWFTKLTGFLPALVFFKPKIYYVDKRQQSLRLPRKCILMSNHKSLMDFVLYFCVFFWQNIRFLMAEVLFRKNKIFSWLLFGLGGVYVNRDTFDFSFIHESIRILDKGGIVGIFPEGRLPVNNKPWPFKPSISYIAANSDAVIIPICTDGNYGLFKRTHIAVGLPINPLDYYKSDNPSEKEIEQFTKFLESKMDELKEFLAVNAKQK